MAIAFTITITLLLILITGSNYLSAQFRKQVRLLFAQSPDISAKKFSYGNLVGLPEPVQRYFRHVLPEGQPFASYIALKHNGQFKTGLEKAWMNISGEQYFTTQTPGFIWKGTTALFTARDMYIREQGRLVVFLLNLLKVADAKGARYDEGELQRWLAESVWFPTNLLPGPCVSWMAVDQHTAELCFQYRNINFTYVVHINDAGEITEMETNRFMGEGARERWIIRLAGYKPLNGIIVPTLCEASWSLKNINYPYARFKVNEIVYNIPEIL